MTTKTMRGIYANGYVLGADYNVLTVASTGFVLGATGAAGGVGGIALSAPLAVTASNSGEITGGKGGDGGVGKPASAGAGGTAAYFAAFSTLTNTATITGGGGGDGGLVGSAGGVGVAMQGGGVLANASVITGGEGGSGGANSYPGTNQPSGGGLGGAAASFAVASTMTNTGVVTGGAGGVGGYFTFFYYPSTYYSGGNGGQGGAGDVFKAGGTLINDGTIMGGVGGAAGRSNLPGFGGAGGSGGSGVYFVGVAAITNHATIMGGAGAYGYASGGAGGAGIATQSGGTLTNDGSITGGAGASGPFYGGAGGAGVAMNGGGSFTNDGTISGGAAGYGAVGGAGVVLTSGGQLTNSGMIAGGGSAGSFGSGGAGVVLASGGQLANSGTITGGGAYAYGGNGVIMKYGGSLTNTGTISSGSGAGKYAPAAVLIDGAGQIANGSATVSNAEIIGGYGVYTYNGDDLTITNYGTIDGTAGPAVTFVGAGDRLIVEGGSVLIGNAYGGGGTLELAAASGTIRRLGATGTLSGGAHGTFSGFGTYVIDAGESWTLAGANAVGTGQTLVNDGTLTTSASFDETVSGVLTNAGLILVKGGAGSAFSGLVFSKIQTLSGGGTVSLNVTGYISGAGASLTNLDNTIEGGGFIKGTLSLTNKGTIDSSVGRMLVNTAGTVVNEGLIENTAAATLLIRNTTIDSSGGGLVAVGHRVQLDNATIEGGTLSVNKGASLISFLHAGTVNLLGGTVTNAGFIDGAAQGLTIMGAVDNTGYVQADNGKLTITGALVGTGQARILQAGMLELDGATSENVVFLTASTGEVVFGDIAGFTGKVLGFSKTGANRIDLKGVAANGRSYAGSAVSGTLTLTENGATVATIKFSGDYRTSTFTLASDGAGGTIITDPPASTPAVLTQAVAAFGAGGGSSSPAGAAPSPVLRPVLASPTG